MIANNLYTEIGWGITCIDADYGKPCGAACYLLEHRGEVAIIETGVQATVPRVAQLLAAKGLGPEAVRYVIPTHVHLDHAGGAGHLMASFPEATLVIHPKGARHMAVPDKLEAGTRAVYGDTRFAELYGSIVPVPEARMQIAEDGFTLDIQGRTLVFRDAPGHANHHFVVWDQLSRGWFSGDTFGVSYPQMAANGRRMMMPSTTPVQFNPEKLLASIAMMMEAAPEAIYLTHFGAVREIPGLAQQLLDKIPRYCEIALACRNDDSPQASIARALLAMERDNLLAIQPHLDAAAIHGVLGLDIELNAQGLAHWVSHL